MRGDQREDKREGEGVESGEREGQGGSDKEGTKQF